MTNISIAFLILVTIMFAGCDLRSDTAKREMEDFSGTPTPTRPPLPVETPIDPSEIVRVGTEVPGDTISVLETKVKKTFTCAKFDRVMINGDDNTLTIKGACQRIMVNGERNEITTDAAAEFLLNGSSNKITYSRFINAKQPLINDNGDTNTIEYVAATTKESKVGNK